MKLWPEVGRRMLDVVCVGLYALCLWLTIRTRRWYVRRLAPLRGGVE